jgi:hypothetical protein
MLRMTSSRFCLMCLLTSFLSSITSTASGFSFSFSSHSSSSHSSQDSGNSPRTTTNRPWGNIGAFKPGLQVENNVTSDPNGYSYSYSYQTSNNGAENGYYLGAAPGTGWPGAMNPMMMSSQQAYAPAYSPAAYAGYPGQMPATATAGQPSVEVEVSETSPFEQQNIVYTVRVVSSDNLKTLNPILPRIEGAALQKVDGPVATLRTDKRSGNQEIVNTYHFKLTPLRSGEIVIPVISFKGTQASSNRQWNGMPGMPPATGSGEAFTIAASKPVSLSVQPAEPTVKPWLPLNDLKLKAQLSNEQRVKEGTPVTLTLELDAKGTVGDQLPTLENQLVSDDFRVYRESTTTKNGISSDGAYLIGSRKETYTLIPLKDGWIRLPQLGVAWWDVDSNTAEIAGQSDQPEVLPGSGNRVNAARAINAGGYPVYFWFPLLITVGIIVGYWLGAWARTRPILKTAMTATVSVLVPLKQRFVASSRVAMQRLNIFEYFRKLRLGLAVYMPLPVKLWMCTRCVEQEDSPGKWCLQFKNRICQHLNIPTQTPLPQIAERLIELNPQAEPAKLRALVQSLDSAIYGARPLDFNAWKSDFRNQLRPRLFTTRRRGSRRAKAELPELNPHSA